MQTIDEVEKHVPIREGEYGEAVAKVEPGGVEYISHSECHGKPIDLFWTWLSPNLEFATVFVGVLGVAIFGLSFWETALAIIVGTALGSLTHFVLSSWGPKFGVPMMVESRGAFGFLGNILPAGLNAFTGSIGWFIVNSVSGAFALQALGGLANLTLPFWLTFLIIVVAQVAIATLGHNFIHVFERWALPLLGVVFIVACAFIFSKANYGVAANPGPVGHFGALTLLFTATFGYAAGWNPYAADYTRYMPPSVDRNMVGFWAAAGVFVSCVVIELAGAALASVPGTKWGPTDIPTVQLRQAMPDFVYYLTLRQRRAVLAVAAGVLGYVIGLVGQANVGPGSKYESFLLLISYWIGTWLAVVFVDYWIRKGDYGDESIFYDTHYQRWQGFAAMAIGLIVSVGLFGDIYGVYVGPIPNNVEGIGDITFIVGFLLTAVLYYGFSMATRSATNTSTAGSRA